MVVLAREEALILKQGHIGPEHILLGLLREGAAGRGDPLADVATTVVVRVAREIQQQLGRSADAGDLLVALDCLPDRLVERSIARLGAGAGLLERAVDEARREGPPAPSSPPAELLERIEQTRRDKEAKIEAQEFEHAANLRDEERRLTEEARTYGDRAVEAALAEARRRLEVSGGE